LRFTIINIKIKVQYFQIADYFNDIAMNINKSIYQSFDVCKRLVWLLWNEGEIKNRGRDESIFRLALQLYPQGFDVETIQGDLETVAYQTKKLLRKPLFNSVFISSCGAAKIDILLPISDDYWEVVSVVAARSIHPSVIKSIAFDVDTLLRCGVEVKKCTALTINPQYQREGEIDPKKFFVKHDITRRVAVLVSQVEDVVSDIYKLIKLSEPPAATYGKHCNRCAFFQNCWGELPEYNFIFRKSKKMKDLIQSRNFDLKTAINNALTERQKIRINSIISGQPYINHRAIKLFLNRLEYPLHFLDFETVSTPFPIFQGTKPFEMVPFQYSLNIVETPEAEPIRFDFIYEGTDDPRKDLMNELRGAIHPTGSIVAYNAGFEKSVLKSCASVLPEFTQWVEEIRQRFVDLLQPFKSLNYYHPKQNGSASLKTVLPILTGKGYDQIKNGEQSQQEYIRLICGGLSADERAAILSQLKQYCYTDSIGMFWIIRELKKLVGGKN